MEDVATFEDLSIDDSLSILERVLRYSVSNIALQRYGAQEIAASRDGWGMMVAVTVCVGWCMSKC
jgi:hypothetical protein